MKKRMSLVAMVVCLVAVCLTGCGQSGAKGTVSTDGSTSMEKVIGALGESFTEKNTPEKSQTGLKLVVRTGRSL